MTNKNQENDDLNFGTPVSGTIADLRDLIEDDEPGTSPPIVEQEEEEEEVPEIKTELGEEEEEEGDAPIVTSTDSPKAFYDKMVALNIWQPIESVETENGEVSIDEIELTDEMLEEIARQQKEAVKNSAVDNLSDFTKKLIEIEKAGGDIQQALQLFQSVQEPLSAIDISTVEGMKSVVEMQLRAKGTDEDVISELIDVYEKKGTLEDRAITAYDEITAAYNQQLQSIEAQGRLDREKRANNLLEYKKGLKEQIEKSFELTPAIVKKIVDSATKEVGDNFELDVLYNTKRKNPVESAKLALFLHDREEYDKQVTNKERNRNTAQTFAKFKLTGTKNSLEIKPKNERRKADEEIDIPN